MRSSPKRASGGPPARPKIEAAAVPVTTARRSLLRTSLEAKHLPLTILAILSAVSIAARVILLLR